MDLLCNYTPKTAEAAAIGHQPGVGNGHYAALQYTAARHSLTNYLTDRTGERATVALWTRRRSTALPALLLISRSPSDLRTLARSGTPCRHLQVQNQNTVSSVDYSNTSIGQGSRRNPQPPPTITSTRNHEGCSKILTS